jgi:hypothetical protein
MSAVQVDPEYTPDGEAHRTCPGVVGASTLAGSVEDGPAIPIIPEGVTNPFFELLKPFKVDAGLADSKATITWKATEPGTYRIVHHGDSKALNGTITPFTGASRTFTVS